MADKKPHRTRQSISDLRPVDRDPFAPAPVARPYPQYDYGGAVDSATLPAPPTLESIYLDQLLARQKRGY